jgi:putative salt-induced outer membrane protein
VAIAPAPSVGSLLPPQPLNVLENAMRFRSLLLLAAVVAGPARAEDALAEGPWSGSVAGGYLATSGNAENAAANLRADVAYEAGKWTHSGFATANVASQSGDSTAEAYTAGAKTRFNFAERFYAFGSVDWIGDRFSAFEYQVFEAAGLGWHAIVPPKHRLDLEAGPGLRQAKLRDIDPDTAGRQSDRQSEAIGLARLEYEWTISETASFLQKGSAIVGSDNTLYESISQLKAGLVGNISLVLGYIVRHNTDVAPGFKKTDTQTTVSLEYAFGKKKT